MKGHSIDSARSMVPELSSGKELPLPYTHTPSPVKTPRARENRAASSLKDLFAFLPGRLRKGLGPGEEALLRESLAELSGPSPLVRKALVAAVAAHRGQVRKGSGRPFIVHPVAVARILLEAGCSDEIVAAGLLHDTLEDTSLTLMDLCDLFAETVAAIVAGCSEPDKSVPWEKRKRHTLHALKTAPLEVRLVTCADKLDNVLSLIEEHREQGEALWDRFTRGRDHQAWYYRSIVQSLSEGPELFEPGTYLLRELGKAVDELFQGARGTLLNL